jgi:hypothetical protein
MKDNGDLTAKRIDFLCVGIIATPIIGLLVEQYTWFGQAHNQALFLLCDLVCVGLYFLWFPFTARSKGHTE